MGKAKLATKVWVIPPEQEREVLLSKDAVLSTVASVRTDHGLPSCCSDTRHREFYGPTEEPWTHLRPGLSQLMKLVVPRQRKKKNL